MYVFLPSQCQVGNNCQGETRRWTDTLPSLNYTFRSESTVHFMPPCMTCMSHFVTDRQLLRFSTTVLTQVSKILLSQECNSIASHLYKNESCYSQFEQGNNFLLFFFSFCVADLKRCRWITQNRSALCVETRRVVCTTQ